MMTHEKSSIVMVVVIVLMRCHLTGSAVKLTNKAGGMAGRCGEVLSMCDKCTASDRSDF